MYLHYRKTVRLVRKQRRFGLCMIIAALTVACLAGFSSSTVPLQGIAEATSASPVLKERKEIRIIVNGKPLAADAAPVQWNGRMMLPFRTFLTAIGVPNSKNHIYWDPAEKQIQVMHKGIHLILWADYPVGYLNDREIELDAPPVISSRNSRVYVPVRLVAESFGLNVNWLANEKKLEVRPMNSFDDKQGEDTASDNPDRTTETADDNSVTALPAFTSVPAVTPKPSPAPSAVPVETSVPTPVPSFKPTPTSTPALTNTPTPTVKPVITSTPIPLVTGTPEATAKPGLTPAPTRFPAKPATVTNTADARLKQIVSFSSSILNNTRTIRIYLPADYEQSQERYPVVYMNDGQNLFGPGGTFGSWKADQAMNALEQKSAIRSFIAVGIDNSADRALEYNIGNGGRVDLYTRFVIEELMPVIREKFRTLEGPENTAIIGSSYGGNAALYMAWERMDVFGLAGVFSPTLAWSDFKLYNRILQEMTSAGKHQHIKLYLYAGEREKVDPDGDGMNNYPEWMLGLAARLAEAGWDSPDKLIYNVGLGEQHNEAAWSKYIGQAFQYLMPRTQNEPFRTESLQVHLSSTEMDLNQHLKSIHVLPVVRYTNGISGILPVPGTKPAFDVSADGRPDAPVDWQYHRMSLNTGQITTPGPLALRFGYGGLHDDVTINVTRQLTRQTKVNIRVTAPSGAPERIYMAGDFGGWGLINAGYWLEKTGSSGSQSVYQTSLLLKNGQKIKFKFLAAPEWAFEEQTSGGGQVSDRIISVPAEGSPANGEMSVNMNIEKWKAVP